VAALLAPILAGGGFVAYVLITTKLGIFREVPWEFLAVSALGAALGVRALVRRPGILTGASAVLSIGLAAFAFHYIFVASMFGPREDRPAVGETFPDFALPTSTGETFRLADATDKRHLVILYRGDW
jgi:hypothetical protein